MLLNQIGVEVIQRTAHLVSVFLIHAEDDSLRKPVGLFHKVSQMARYGLGASTQRNQIFEILGLVLLVGDHSAVAV